MRRKRNHRVLLAIGGVGQARANVLLRQVRIIVHDFLPAHPGSNPTENIAHCNTKTTDTRLTTAFTGFNCDEFAIIHDNI